MTKLTFLIIAVVSLITNIYAACSDDYVKCVDKRGHIVGYLKTGFCFDSSKASCKPCREQVFKGRISYRKYLIECRIKYRQAVGVIYE